MKSFLLFLLFALASVFCSTKQKLNLKQDFGYNGPELNAWSGYVTVSQSHGRNLFYTFIQKEKNPENAPVVFWFQGGPGCSSLAGLFLENGPVRVNQQNGLDYTDLGWTQHANMVWFEQPAGVGFSYSDTPSDYNTNDTQAAADNYVFLNEFFTLFPEFRNNDVWLTGESYGGVYLPTVTNLVLSNSNTVLYKQFKGFMAGNPVMSCESLTYEANTFNLLYWHGLVSYTNYYNWQQNGCNANARSGACQDVLKTAINQVGEIVQELAVIKPQPSLDPDDLYQDFCIGNGTLEFTKTVPGSPECVDTGDLLTKFLNTDKIQTALGVRKTYWSTCSSKINYTPSGASMIPLYRNFPNQKPSVRILVYSGDIDIMTVPFAMTKQCLAELSSTNRVVAQWQPWFVNGATAGYVEQFTHYTYATLKGGGHEAPEYQPLNAINMFERFLNGKNLTAFDDVAHRPTLGNFGGLTQGSILRNKMSA